MNKNNDETLEKQLREIQTLLSEPGKKIVGVLSYYLNFLNPLAKNGKNQDSEDKKSSTQTQRHNNITWVDVENPSRKAINRLAKDYPFHPLHLEASLLKGQLPQIEKEEHYLFLLLHVPSYNTTENKIATDQVCIFLGKNYLVTVHEDSAPGIRDLFNICQEDKEQRNAYFKKSPGYLLYNVLDSLIKDLSAMLQTILQELDEIEDVVFDDKVSGAYKIGQLRHKIIRLRRIIGFSRKIFEDLIPSTKDFTGDNLSDYYENITRTINKLWETIEEARETVEIYKDADFIMSTEKTNTILALLTIIFTLTVPATVLGTFYGMNILLPGGIEDGAWTFLGSYTTLIFVLTGSILPVLLMLGYFKYKNWF